MKFGIIILAILTSASAHAQNLFNQSVISIGSTSVVFLKDSIINHGTIINNGDMQVGGSWINNAQYEAGQGQISFNSDLPQVINHNDQSFSRLTISGGGQKIFAADITIENELVLTQGILIAENNSRIIFSNGSQIVGGSDAAYIQGPVYHHGSGDKLFPLGNGSLYLPVSLVNIEDPSALIGIEGVEMTGGMLSKAPSLDAISDNRYWHIDVVSGSLENSQIILPVREESLLNDISKVVVAESPALSEKFRTIGRASSEGTVNNGMVTSERAVTMPFVTVAGSSSRGELIVYNAISANNDTFNEYLIIENIENYPENKFSLFNRWGDKIFEIENYDNKERVFRGKSNINGEGDLVNGTYFYIIETKQDNLKVNGFLALKN